MFERCVQVAPPHLQHGNVTCVAVKNVSSMDIQLQRTSGAGPAELTLLARSTYLLRIRVQRSAEPLELGYTATNFWIEPEKGLPVVLRIAGK